MAHARHHPSGHFRPRRETMGDKVTLTDVWTWLNRGFEAAIVDSELIPDHFRRQYGMAVAKLRRQIANDQDPTIQPYKVDTLSPETTLGDEARLLFTGLKQLRAKLIADHIDKYA